MNKENHDKLTILQAFNAMTIFFNDYYEKTASDNMGSLLGDMRLLEDGTTADTAAWHQWINDVEVVLENENKIGNFKKIMKKADILIFGKNMYPNKTLSPLDAFKAMIYFLERYYNNTSHPDDIGSLLCDMRLENEKAINPTIWQNWIDITETILTNHTS